MEKYSKANTILLWTKNQDIIKFTTDIAQELKLNIYNGKVLADLTQVPSFIIIVDTEFLIDNFQVDFNNYIRKEDSNRCSLVIVGKKLVGVPYRVKPLITYVEKAITKEYIHSLIEKAMGPIKNPKQEKFEQRVHRIIYLYILLNEGKKKVFTKDLIEHFQISERTLRRDIKVLKDVCDKEIVFDKDYGYVLCNYA